ncbi:TRAP transporter small permease [Salinicola sp. MIT1003]|uniref:TRAP transporter small permease n=1 Tax=Salinicola sp. MIT1003 TaxID=1882734 RepID=UPI0008DE1AD1|nr:TRAP transporter small permease [Salinicola sp. MIT1003]OHZ01617.1 hypothetical protein BC443_11350 [Salinicola sp. MIT1003]
MEGTTKQTFSDNHGAVATTALFIRYLLDIVLGSMMFVMCVVMAWQVFARYVLGDASSWSAEVARSLMVWMAMVGSAAVIQRGGHVTVTVLLDRLPLTIKGGILVIRDLIMLIILGVMFFYGLSFAEMNAIQLSAALEISMAWIYASLWVGSALMAVVLVLIRLERRAPDWTRDADGFE